MTLLCLNPIDFSEIHNPLRKNTDPEEPVFNVKINLDGVKEIQFELFGPEGRVLEKLHFRDVCL